MRSRWRFRQIVGEIFETLDIFENSNHLYHIEGSQTFTKEDLHTLNQIPMEKEANENEINTSFDPSRQSRAK